MQVVEALGRDQDHMGHILEQTGPQCVSGGDQRLAKALRYLLQGLVGTFHIVGHRTDLQQFQLHLLYTVLFHDIGRKLNLHLTGKLFPADFQDLVQGLAQRETIVFQQGFKRDHPRSVRCHARPQPAVGTVKGRCHQAGPGIGGKHFCRSDVGEVDALVAGNLEGSRPHIQGIEHTKS